MNAKFNIVKYNYVMGTWSEIQVKNAVRKKWITREEYATITGKNFNETDTAIA